MIRERDRRESRELSMGLLYDQRLHRRFDYVVGVDYFRRRERRSAPAIAPPPDDPLAAVPAQRAADLLHRTRIRGNGTLRLLDVVRLVAGGDVTFESGRSASELDFDGSISQGRYSESRTVGGPFVGLVLEHDAGITLRGDLRADLGDGTGARWTPRLGAALRVPDLPVTLRGSWGHGFKRPAFFAIADPLVGNEDLRAEESDGWDVGVEALLFERRLRVSVAYFELRVEELIDFDFESFQLVNRDRVLSRGFEAGLWADLPLGFDLTGALTHARTDIRNSDDRLRRRPRWRGSAGLGWRPDERVSLGIDALFVGSVRDESSPTGPVKLDPWWRLDARVDLRVWREIRLYLAIENLTDAHYEEAVGFPGTGFRPSPNYS